MSVVDAEKKRRQMEEKRRWVGWVRWRATNPGSKILLVTKIGVFFLDRRDTTVLDHAAEVPDHLFRDPVPH